MPIYQQHHLSIQIIESSGESISELIQEQWSHLHPAQLVSRTMLQPGNREGIYNRCFFDCMFLDRVGDGIKPINSRS